MCVHYPIGTAVLVSGYRSNSNPRRRAGGSVIGVRSDSYGVVYDVEAYVDGHGAMVVRGLRASDLACAA